MMTYMCFQVTSRYMATRCSGKKQLIMTCTCHDEPLSSIASLPCAPTMSTCAAVVGNAGIRALSLGPKAFQPVTAGT